VRAAGLIASAVQEEYFELTLPGELTTKECKADETAR
jgi:hypothetical protein